MTSDHKRHEEAAHQSISWGKAGYGLIVQTALTDDRLSCQGDGPHSSVIATLGLFDAALSHTDAGLQSDITRVEHTEQCVSVCDEGFHSQPRGHSALHLAQPRQLIEQLPKKPRAECL
jgi:hypothetical protein